MTNEQKLIGFIQKANLDLEQAVFLINQFYRERAKQEFGIDLEPDLSKDPRAVAYSRS